MEQNAQLAFEVCHRGYVFEIGSVAFEGEKETLLEDEREKKIIPIGEK